MFNKCGPRQVKTTLSVNFSKKWEQWFLYAELLWSKIKQYMWFFWTIIHYRNPWGISVLALQIKNPTVSMNIQVWFPASLSVLGQSDIALSCSVGCRYCSDLALLWLWCRLIAAASIWPLARELPYCTEWLKKKKKERKKEKKKRRNPWYSWFGNHSFIHPLMYSKIYIKPYPSNSSPSPWYFLLLEIFAHKNKNIRKTFLF